MTGSLATKNGKYYVVLNLYVNGKRKKKWIGTNLAEKGNRRKAEQILREKIMEYERKEGLIYSDTSFSDYIRFWLDMTSRKVDAITMQGYQILANTHILPYFAELEIPLADVDWRILQAYIDEKARSGRVDGKGGLSPRSLRLHKNILNQALNLAVKNSLILTNPCQFVVLPQVVSYESKFYSAEQLKALFAALEEDPMLQLPPCTGCAGASCWVCSGTALTLPQGR